MRNPPESCNSLRTGTLWIVLFAVFLTASLAAYGCGKKSWPEPRGIKERFGWINVQAIKHDSCIKISALMTGNWSNLDEVALELSPTEEAGACATCPFHPSLRLTFRPGSPGLSLDGPAVTIESCQLDSTARYRYRLVGKNIYSGLADTHSSVQITPISE